VVVWIRGGATAEIWANRYAPEGGWGTPERIDAAEAREATSPQLAIDAAGNVVASWGQTDGVSDAGVWANRFTPTVGWGRTERLGAPGVRSFVGGRAPTLAVDPEGTAFVVWVDNLRELWSCRFTSLAGWGSAEIIRSGDSMSDPHVAAGPDSTAFVVWGGATDGRSDIWASRYTATGGWGSPRLIEADDEGPVRDPRAAVDAAGNAVVVWSHHDGVRYNIWSNRYTLEEGWGDAQRIEADNAGSARNPRVVVDASGNALAVWSQEGGAVHHIWSNHFTPSDGWQIAEKIEHSEGNNAFGPELLMDERGNALAVWKQTEASEMHIASNRYTPSAGWGVPQGLSAVVRHVDHPALAVDEDGRITAAWTQWSDSDGAYSILSRRFD
jgi:hypothetical protein